MPNPTLRNTYVPVFVWPIVATLFIFLMSFTIGTSSRSQETRTKVEHNTSEIEKLETEKASSERIKALDKSVDRNYELMVRIDGKLDEHISKTTE